MDNVREGLTSNLGRQHYDKRDGPHFGEETHYIKPRGKVAPLRWNLLPLILGLLPHTTHDVRPAK
jgi:hypothetical protein